MVMYNPSNDDERDEAMELLAIEKELIAIDRENRATSVAINNHPLTIAERNERRKLAIASEQQRRAANRTSTAAKPKVPGRLDLATRRLEARRALLHENRERLRSLGTAEPTHRCG